MPANTTSVPVSELSMGDTLILPSNEFLYIEEVIPMPKGLRLQVRDDKGHRWLSNMLFPDRMVTVLGDRQDVLF